MGKDITTTQILSTCAHCGETVEYSHGAWVSENGRTRCADRTTHTVDLSHALSHMTVEG